MTDLEDASPARDLRSRHSNEFITGGNALQRRMLPQKDLDDLGEYGINRDSGLFDEEEDPDANDSQETNSDDNMMQ